MVVTHAFHSKSYNAICRLLAVHEEIASPSGKFFENINFVMNGKDAM